MFCSGFSRDVYLFYIGNVLNKTKVAANKQVGIFEWDTKLRTGIARSKELNEHVHFSPEESKTLEF